MGCDIHSYAEKKDESGTFRALDFAPFDWRSYGMYGFLAGVRNYSGVPTIAERRGFPQDASAEARADYENWSCDAHTPSWLSVQELAAFDYEAPMEDRRVTRQIGPDSWHGGCTCEPGEGQRMTWREFLGQSYFDDLTKLQELGADRIVFWFDN